MILIVGGACQGKREFARKLAGEDEESFAKKEANGVSDRPKAAWEKMFLTGFQGWIRQITEAGEDPEEFVKKVLENEPEIVTMDEVGCGIVPIDRQEREYREAAGRAGQMLAGHAREAFRVVCGIGIKIKG